MGASELPAVDAITWVPLARRRRSERGYDQARALANGLGRRQGLPVVRLLRRTSTTGPQARLGGAARREAMRGVFAAVRPCPSIVLLVDDVLTTGATAAECAQALVEGGAREVHLVTAARAVRARPDPALQPGLPPAYPRVGPTPGLWLPGDVPR
jgi:predicted amidophosphoribosyltransferase